MTGQCPAPGAPHLTLLQQLEVSQRVLQATSRHPSTQVLHSVHEHLMGLAQLRSEAARAGHRQCGLGCQDIARQPGGNRSRSEEVKVCFVPGE